LKGWRINIRVAAPVFRMAGEFDSLVARCGRCFCRRKTSNGSARRLPTNTMDSCKLSQRRKTILSNGLPSWVSQSFSSTKITAYRQQTTSGCSISPQSLRSRAIGSILFISLSKIIFAVFRVRLELLWRLHRCRPASEGFLGSWPDFGLTCYFNSEHMN
jgi:hypothetical protein